MAYKNKADMAKYHREVWYPKNKERRKEITKSYKDANQQRYLDWKKQQKCIVCSESESVCLDLHHKDPTQKDFLISQKSKSSAWSTLEKEIQKCVVLCSNCHRKVHAGLIQLAE